MLVRILDRLEETIIATLMGGATLVIFAAVAHRFLGGVDAFYDVVQAINMSWAQELCIYMFVWMAKFGAAYGVRTGIHVGVDVLLNTLKSPNKRKIILFSLLSGAFFTAVIGTLGANLVLHIARTSQVSADLEIPMWLVYLAVPVGSYLMCFRFLQVAWRFIRTGDVPFHEHTQVDGVEEHAEAAEDKPGATEDDAGSAANRRFSWVMLLLPMALVAACFLAKFGILDLSAGVRIGLLFCLMLSLFVTGMPISIALGLTVLTFLFTLTKVPLESVALKLFTGIEKFEVMAVPFFILAGNFLTHGGVARRMIRFASSLIGHWYGGLGLAGVMACSLFAAISGSSPATVVAIGSIILPAMVQAGYPPRFGAGVITTSGALGILIPPSITMVIYSVATSGMVVTGPAGQKVSAASVGQLFMAGVIPGLMLATLLGFVTWYRAKKNDYPREVRATWGERFDALRNSIWGLLLVVLVLGGIYSGLFTPTEAAGVSAVYAFIVAVFIYKDLKLSDVPRILLSSANMSAMLLYIITNAVLFSFLMAHENIPQMMAEWIINKGLGIVAFLLVVNLLLLAAGNVMDPAAIVLIMAPILFPVAVKLGIDPIHFGIMIVVNMEIGLCHPPVGLNLYVASSITKMGITELTIAVWPWLLAMLGFLMLVTFVPEISLWLPRMLGML